jgi:hypothetical protein
MDNKIESKNYGGLRLWEHRDVLYVNFINEIDLTSESVIQIKCKYDPVGINWKDHNTDGYIDLIISCRFPKTVINDGLSFQLIRFSSIVKYGDIAKEDLSQLKQYAIDVFNEFILENNYQDMHGNLLKMPDFNFEVKLLRGK